MVKESACNAGDARDSSLIWDSPGKNIGVGCHFLFHGVLLNPGIESVSPVAPALQTDSLPLGHQGNPEYEHTEC